MSRLEIILSATLTLSVIINIGVFVYARYAIVQLLSVSEELGDLQQMINSFAEHLNSIYELEMFYGDDTLESLIKHSKQLLLDVQEFYDNFSLDQEEEEDDGS